MKYVFDSNSLIALGQFYPSRFPSLWGHVNSLVTADELCSVSECLKEIEAYNQSDYLKDWSKTNKRIFKNPCNQQGLIVSDIFKVVHFQQLISKEAQLKGKPVADPFVIASAKYHGAIVVTEEKFKEHAAKIPNICKHFGVQYMNLEAFMTAEGLVY